MLASRSRTGRKPIAIASIASDAEPEFTSLVVDEHGAAAEAVFVGTHIGDFSGVSATGNQVRVPCSVFYDVDGDKIKSLRIYLPMDQLIAQIGGAAEPEAARQGLTGRPGRLTEHAARCRAKQN